MSTAGPDVLEELAPLVTKTGSTFVDAPVVGAPPNVLKGAALLIAGGERADVERVQPVLERLGELRHAGPFGSGDVYKRQSLTAASTAAVDSSS